MKRIGAYRVLHQLAQGGVAEVFLARRDGPGGFSTPVVVKRLKAAYRFDVNCQRSIIAEARVGALLDHHNIIRYLDLLEDSDEIFAVTEYLHGVTARRLIQDVAQRGPEMQVPFALYLVGEVLDALDYAHHAVDDRGASLQIVHRDISPENVFLCMSGGVKVMDFGIARTTITPRDTNVHVIKGKARYFSPEQAQGQGIGPQSDIYAVGLLLFEMLTGTPAIEGSSERNVVQRARSGEVASARTARPDLPDPLTAILDTALAVQPAQRYASAFDMAHDVRILQHRLSPGFGAAEVRGELEARFGRAMEVERRKIWCDQATQVADAVSSISSDAVVSNVARGRGTPRVATGKPRYCPSVLEDAEPASVPGPSSSPQQKDESSEQHSAVDLDALRRAITEAYDE